MSVQGYSQIMRVDTQANLPATANIGEFAYCIDVGLVFIFDGTNWNVSSKVAVKKTSTSVNAKNTGATAVYTLEASSLKFFPILIIPRATGVGVSGVTVGPTISVGTNSTSYNNIASTSLMGNILSTLSAGSSAPSTTSFSPALTGGTQIFVNVTVGALATNYTVLYDIIGFYDN